MNTPQTPTAEPLAPLTGSAIALRATMKEWRERHQLTPTFYNIENSRAYDRETFLNPTP